MDRNRWHRFTAWGLLVSICFIAAQAHSAEPTSGRMITLRGTIDSALVQRVNSTVRDAARSGVEIVIFDIQVGQSDFGACYDLANSIAQIGGSVRRTVAYISKPLTGNAVLVALACDEIVLAGKASIGDVEVAGDLKPREKAMFESIAVEKGHGKWIAAGLADKSLRLYEVETTNGKSIKAADELAEFEKNARVLKKDIIKESGQRWVLSSELAQRLGLVRLVKDSRSEVVVAYGLSEQVAAEDSTFKEATHPLLLKIEGAISPRILQAVQRRLQDAERQGSTLLFIEIDSTGGDLVVASSLMNTLDQWPGRKVAWVPNNATGSATLLLFGCDEVVVGPKANIGSFVLDGKESESAHALADGAVEAARESKIPEAIVRGLVNASEEIWEVRNKENGAIRSFRTAEQLEADGDAGPWEKVRTAKERGNVMKLEGGEQARAMDFAVAVVEGEPQLFSTYAIQGPVPVLKPTWVDDVVNGLTSPGATVFLLAVGLTCLYLEFQMAGFGVAGLLSAVCFVLFFWSRFLSDTANSLEIVMFILGLFLVALEIFVLPGFGVAGITGVLLIFASIILASQSFPWPTTESETRILMGNVVQLVLSMAIFIGGAVVIARFFPSLPMFNRMVLPPPGELAEGRFPSEGDEGPMTPYDNILGDVGVAASPLRPVGRMKLGSQYFDVITNGEFVEAGRRIEVVEVHHNRIVVRSIQDLV